MCSYANHKIALCYTSGCSNNPPSIGAAYGGRIPDVSFSATSYWHNSNLPKHGRLNAPHLGWAAKTPNNMPNEYLQIDLGGMYWVCGVATQGNRGVEWTTKYKISLSLDNITWNIYQWNSSDKVRINR